MILNIIIAAAVGAGTTGAPAAGSTVEARSTRDVLREFFPASERVDYVVLEDRVRPAKDRYVVFVARSGARVDGYAVVDDVPGEHLPITLAVKVSPSGRVDRVEILAYREAYGGEVRDERFRAQFAGRGVEQPFRLGHEIDAISGATISSRAMVAGVRRALQLVALARGGGDVAAR